MADRRFSSLWSRILRDYTTLFVLLLLCAGLSVVTLARQQPAGATAGRQLARMLASELADGDSVLIVVGDISQDQELATALQKGLKESQIKVVATVQGSPADARHAIETAIAAGRKIDAIACTESTSIWSLLDRLDEKFPGIGNPRVVRPQSYLWPNFLKTSNLLNIANQIAVIAIVAIGMTMVIIGGGIDLSVGSLTALSAVVMALTIRDLAGGYQATAIGMGLSSLAAIAMCAAIGALTGSLVAQLRIQPFIVTLALMSIGRGLAFILSEGQSVYEIPPSVKWLGAGADLGVPNAVVLMIVLYVLADLVMKRTVFGRHLYAVGGNRAAAHLCGIPVQRMVLWTYVISGGLAGLAGVILTSQFQSGAPTFALNYELQVIAAVVVGGTSLSGGVGRMFGTLQGALTIAVVQNGMNLLGLGGPSQAVVLGLVILLAAALDRAKSFWVRQS
jgi:ribose transport system permease protein